MKLEPLDPYSIVVDERRKWTPEWYRWLQDLVGQTTDMTNGDGGGVTPPSMQSIVPVSFLSGFNVGSVNEHVIYTNGGSIWSPVDNAVYTTFRADAAGAADNGLPNALDTNQVGIRPWSGDIHEIAPEIPAQGKLYTSMLGGMLDGRRPVDGDDIFVVILRSLKENPPFGLPANTLVLCGTCAMRGRELSYSYLTDKIPAGWAVVRFLPFAVKFKTGRGPFWNGLPDFFTPTHGGTKISFVGSTDSGSNYLLQGQLTGTGTAFASDLVPSPCLTLTVQYAAVRIDTVSPAANAKLGGGAELHTVATLGPTDPPVYGEMTFRTDTGLGFKYACDTGIALRVFLKATEFEEPV